MSCSLSQWTPWLLRGRVIHGFGRGGSQLGFPTANLELSEDIMNNLLPYKETVLYGWGCIEASAEDSKEEGVAHLGPYPFAMSVGTNPHFKNAQVSVEPYFVHEFPSDFYGRIVRIVVLGKIRESIAFTTIEKLIDTIKEDVSCALNKLKVDEENENSWKKNDALNPFIPLSGDSPLPLFRVLQ